MLVNTGLKHAHKYSDPLTYYLQTWKWLKKGVVWSQAISMTKDASSNHAPSPSSKFNFTSSLNVDRDTSSLSNQDLCMLYCLAHRLIAWLSCIVETHCFPITRLTTLTMSSIWGRAAFSKLVAYGIGTSAPVILSGGASRSSKASSFTVAMISAVIPHCGQPSSTATTLWVFLTEATIVSLSKGFSVLILTTCKTNTSVCKYSQTRHLVSLGLW